MDPVTMSYAQLLEAYQALQEHVIALEEAAAVQQQAPAWGHEAHHTVRTRDPERAHLFPGDSELARRMRDLDWSQTDLGPPEHWPENLRIAVRICLTSRFPIVLWWGQDYTMF